MNKKADTHPDTTITRKMTDALLITLIHRLGGSCAIQYSVLADPDAILDQWRVHFHHDEDNDVYTFVVREFPRRSLEDRVEEAAVLLGDGSETLDWQAERALWLLTDGAKGDPRWSEYSTGFMPAITKEIANL